MKLSFFIHLLCLLCGCRGLSLSTMRAAILRCRINPILFLGHFSSVEWALINAGCNAKVKFVSLFQSLSSKCVFPQRDTMQYQSGSELTFSRIWAVKKQDLIGRSPQTSLFWIQTRPFREFGNYLSLFSSAIYSNALSPNKQLHALSTEYQSAYSRY